MRARDTSPPYPNTKCPTLARAGTRPSFFPTQRGRRSRFAGETGRSWSPRRFAEGSLYTPRLSPVTCDARICNDAVRVRDETREVMSDKRTPLRAKSDDVARPNAGSPPGHGQHGRTGIVAHRSQSYDYAPSSRLANRARGAHDGITHPGIAGH